MKGNNIEKLLTIMEEKGTKNANFVQNREKVCANS